VDSLFLFDAAVGLALVAAIVIAAVRPPSMPPAPSWLAWLLVATLPVVVLVHLVLPGPEAVFQVAFLLAVVGFGLGAILILATDDQTDEDWRAGDIEPPPWWPDFERDFRDYVRERPRPRVGV
jgi:hypothetical protein